MPSEVIEVRYKSGYATFQIVIGAVICLLGICLALLPGTGYAIAMLFPGAVLVTLGTAALSKPYCSFDPDAGALYLHPPLFGSPRPIGEPRGERLYVDGTRIIRELPNGKRREVKLSMTANEGDLARMRQAMPEGPA
jgi:hypothetical protein